MSYCEKHPEYKGVKRPNRNNGTCFSCWRLYLKEKDITVEMYLESLSVKDSTLKDWLREHIDDIIYAPIILTAKLTESSIAFLDDVVIQDHLSMEETLDLILDRNADLREKDEPEVMVQKGRFT
jgi:hypothetical protein